jgi:ankyrin repeat protein
MVARNADGDTALHLAAKTGRLKVAEQLVGVARAWPDDPNSEDTLLKNPLMMTNKEGNNPLHEAVRHRKTAVALALLDADHSRAYDLNEKMESPLHMAAREGLVHVVRKVFDFAWVEPQYVSSAAVSGTALHQAVLGGHTST